MEASVSAYSLSTEETDESPNIGACGPMFADNLISCPAFLNCGTRVAIDGVMYKCWDRMNIRYRNGNYFDLLLSGRQEAIQFGRKEKIIKIYYF